MTYELWLPTTVLNITILKIKISYKTYVAPQIILLTLSLMMGKIL